MAKSQKNWQGCEATEPPIALLVKMQNSIVSLEYGLAIFYKAKINIVLPYDLPIVLLGT